MRTYTQLDMFAPHPYAGKLPHARDSKTSEAAAARATPTAKSNRRMIFEFLQRVGGATDDEIEEMFDLLHQTASARRRELVLQGMVCDSGHKRPTRSGSEATVWEVIP